jgi:hypothetical protein
MYAIHDSRLINLMCSRGPADCSGTQFWPLYRFGAETGNDFRSIQDSIRSRMNHRLCRANRIYVAANDPEPISEPNTDPEPNPESKTDPEDE